MSFRLLILPCHSGLALPSVALAKLGHGIYSNLLFSFKMLKLLLEFLGLSVNGKPRVSKTRTGGSTPPSPATSNLKKRFGEHQSGKVFATKGRLPLKLIFYEAFLNQKDSIRREKYFKTNPGKRSLKLMLRHYFKK